MRKLTATCITGLFLALILLTGCTSVQYSDAGLAKVDMTKWRYNAGDDVFYQIGIQYVQNPADTTYETLSIFVPAAYFTAVKNADDTYTCSINANAAVHGYTAGTAPIVFPVETPGYSAMAALTDYSSEAAVYCSNGFIYLHAGCRGRNEGAPAGVTDLKAAIRYYRYCSDLLPGDTGRFFSFGMSGGGAQSALMGVTGDSDEYIPYLEAIGAVMEYSDAIAGSMCWCPITNLDVANEAYEWNMGRTRTGLDSFTQQLSLDLAEAFAEAVNSMGLTDDEGTVLMLQPSDDGYYQEGTFYDWIVSEVERSLNNFIADTVFPYDSSASSGKGGQGPIAGGPMGGNGGPMAGGPMNGGRGGPDGNEGPMNGGMDYAQRDNIARNKASGTVTVSGVYETIEDYIAELNSAGHWVDYDSTTKTVTITSLADFAKAMKPASKNVGAFDDLSASQGENTLFGTGNGQGQHWDDTMAQILTGTEYEASYMEDLAATDALGTDKQTRLNMYTPSYYLLESSSGYASSTVAKYWRIRSGISQGDTSVSTEASLAQALKNYGDCQVDFEMVWGQQHVKAERTGDSTTNFINWVHDCLN